MAWSYSDYDSYTDPAGRAARLRLHIAEVRAAIGPDMSSSPGSVNFANLIALLGTLKNELSQLERDMNGTRFVRGRSRW